MEISITGRHTSVSDAMKSYATEKFSRLERHNDMVSRAEVIMNIENERHMVDMIAHTRVGGVLVGKAEHTDMYAAIDLLLDKMEHQLSKQKERVKVERKHSSRSGRRPAVEGPETGKARAGGEEGAGESEGDVQLEE